MSPLKSLFLATAIFCVLMMTAATSHGYSSGPQSTNGYIWDASYQSIPSGMNPVLTRETDADHRVLYQNRTRFNQTSTQTLLGSTVRHGGFGALVYGYTSFNDELVYFSGTRGAWILNLSELHALHIGLSGYRTKDVDPVDWPHPGIAEPKLRTNYGGLELEYVNKSYRLVHVGGQLLIGSGNVRFDDRDIDVESTRDSYFVLQPGVNAFVNVTRWFRISGGLHYRYASNVTLDGTDDSNLSGLTCMVNLRFGKF